jgi:predicted CXXCH cytochrome family protein
MTDTGRTSNSRYLLAGLVVLLGLGGLGAWLALRKSSPPEPPGDPSPSTDPRRTYAGPYRNIHPDVRYVGDARCVECHKDIVGSYAGHPMGQSLVPAEALARRQRYSADTHNPFTALGRHFEVRQKGKGFVHRQAVDDDAGGRVVELDQEIDWVIGSGKKGYSYLVERDGYLLQTAISWFTQKQRWDLSPGFAAPVLAGRVVPASCLFCHTNQVRQHPEHLDRFVAPVFEGLAIGCERCHGPGELHVRGDMDHTIVNPARLAPPLRDAVCEQCHLEGEVRITRSGRGLFDFRPGLPLHDFWAVLVESGTGGEDAKAVNHVEQMYQSRCFQRPVDGRKMGCTTCHDPHVAVPPDKRVSHYRAACLKCHAEAKGQRGCSVPAPRRRQTSPQDSCIDCHMPRYTSSDIVHTASTDHCIVRRPAPRSLEGKVLDGAKLVDFYRDRFPQGDPQAERNLGVGLGRMLSGGILSPQREGERVVHLLERALAEFPRDVELRRTKALTLGLLGRSSEALAVARQVLSDRPGDWQLLVQEALAAQAEGQLDQAADAWRKAVQINPCVADYQVSLLRLLIGRGKLDEVGLRARNLVRLDPFSVPGRQALVVSLLHQGKQAEARREFEVIRRLKPADLAKLEEWFRKQVR